MKKKSFCEDFKSISAAERMLQTSIEGILDIGNYIIAIATLEMTSQVLSMIQHHISRPLFQKVPI
ncbi:MAG: hypothetical protein ABIE74_00460 [Pseudomonadota bacterium]